jgi:hypothetical protein
MTTAVQMQLRRDTAVNLAAATPAQGEPAVDTTRNRLAIGDGSTAGGWPHAKLKDAQGYGFVANYGLVAAAASNNLTVTLKTAAGNNPSAADSIFVPFRTAPASDTELPAYSEVIASSSITIASGDTLGTVANVPFRFWIVLFPGGILGVVNCITGGASPTQIFDLDESVLQSPSASIGNSAGTLYSAASVAANSPFRILGYLDYASGLSTAGAYNSAPSKIQLFGPGVHLPGAVIKTLFVQPIATGTTTTGTTKTATSLTASISLRSAANLVLVRASGTLGTQNSGSVAACQLGRNSSSTLIGNNQAVGNFDGGGSYFGSGVTMEALDAPGATSSQSYTVYYWANTGGTAYWNTASASPGYTASSVMFLQEISA